MRPLKHGTGGGASAPSGGAGQGAPPGRSRLMHRPPEPGATRSRYSGGAILFHWVIAALIIANIAIALLSEDWERPARIAAGDDLMAAPLERFG